MKYLGILAVGLFIGYFAGHRSPPPQEAAQCEPASDKETKSAARVEQPRLDVPKINAKRIETPPAKLRQTSPAKVEAMKPGRHITLTSETVKKLEEDWRDLAQQVRLVRENDGWRVTNLQNNSLFAQIGFRDGDLITANAIESLRTAEPGHEDLPERFLKVLNQVTY